MKTTIRRFPALGLAAVAMLITLNAQLSTAYAQGTAFTYQGRLNAGANVANGVYDFRFAVYDSTNLPGTLIAGPVTNAAVFVTNGYFLATLDFGAGVFTGAGRWLDMAVRTNGAGGFTALTPRQQVMPVPYAIMSGTTSNLLGTVPVAQVSGTIPLAQLPTAVVTNNATGISMRGSFNGNFSGNGAGLTNVSIAGVTIQQNSNGWPNVIEGSPSNAIENNPDNPVVGATIGGGDANHVTAPFATISGGQGNTADQFAVVGGGSENNAEAINSTIAGGASNIAQDTGTTVGGGQQNTAGDAYAQSLYATVAGGSGNTAIGQGSTVGGGEGNSSGYMDGLGNIYGIDATVAGGNGNATSGDYSVIGGGYLNQAGARSATVAGGEANTASGTNAVVGGGYGNLASGNYATIPGGYQNLATGQYSLAAGNHAQATNNGSFVWADAQGTPFGSTTSNQFNVRASGGVRLVTGGAGLTLDGAPVLTNGPAGVTLTGTFSGNGIGLTNLNATKLTGTAATLSASNIIVLSSITGNGAGLTNLNAANLTGSISNLTLTGNLNLSATTNNAGIIYSGGITLIHSFGTANFFAGTAAGNLTMSGTVNSGVGVDALSSDTSGSFNTANGYSALVANTTGSFNTAMGADALMNNKTGTYNTAVGGVVMLNNTNGSYNLAAGYGALYYNTSGENNSAIGFQALVANTSGSYNIGLGYGAGSNITNSYNIDIGNPGVASDSGTIRIGTQGTHTNTLIAGVINGDGGGLTNLNAANLTGPISNLTLIGSLTLPTTTTNGGVICSGGSTLIHNFGAGNFFAGKIAGNLTMSGSGNVGVGFSALYWNANGSGNTANGSLALYWNVSGNDNTAIGTQALYNNMNGNDNTANGFCALSSNMSGSNNIALGYYAGFTVTNNNNIDIGNLGLAADNGIIRIGTPGTHTNTFIAGVINGNGGGLTNLNAANLTGVLPVAQLPAAVVTNNESGVTLATLTLSGNLNLSASGIIYSGGNTLLDYYGTRNFFAGPSAGNLTMSGTDNTGIGVTALQNNASGRWNTAIGSQALAVNNQDNNTAVGSQALQNNTTGSANTANGSGALLSNTFGANNTANGYAALYANVSGSNNVAIGLNALRYNTTGGNNTAEGFRALETSISGNNNIALGYQAGYSINGNNNIDIGNFGTLTDNGVIRIGTQGTQTAAYIAGIYNTTVSGVAVQVNSSGQLGVPSSSRKFKQDIKSMANQSEELLALHPVSFKYKPEIEPQGLPQFGLIAEEVEQVDPDLVVHDKEHGIYTVRYDAVNAMLLNEFLKEHRKVQDLEQSIAELRAQVEKLANK